MGLFATCLPGLEPLLSAELAELGLHPTEVHPGGVELPAEPSAVGRVTTDSALAIHLLWRCATFRCRSLGELQRKSESVGWDQWLVPKVPACLRVYSRRSRLYHTGAIAERVGSALTKIAGVAVVPAPKGDVAGATAEDPVPVVVHFDRDQCTLSLDLAGVPLHRRGYRLDPGSAPLREDLAAAMLRATGWRSGMPLLDPMCGGGTVLLEAARQVAGIPPGSGRPMAWQRTRFATGAEPAAAQPLEPMGSQQESVQPQEGLLLGADRATEQLERARKNAARAGVEDQIRWEAAPLRRCSWLADPGHAPVGTCVVTHPPFGLRSGNPASLRELHQTLGNGVQRLPGPWRFGIMVQDRKLAYATGIRVRSAFMTRQGSLPVHGMTGEATGQAVP